MLVGSADTADGRHDRHDRQTDIMKGLWPFQYQILKPKFDILVLLHITQLTTCVQKSESRDQSIENYLLDEYHQNPH